VDLVVKGHTNGSKLTMARKEEVHQVVHSQENGYKPQMEREELAEDQVVHTNGSKQMIQKNTVQEVVHSKENGYKLLTEREELEEDHQEAHMNG